eukprot:scpid28580/ scgid6619/ L-threonine dehydratase catabolic TdcB; Threonine deaminase &gt; L-threonine dehydratase catabolic TdcB; Threonine deaminase &gt; L-threonine dehydratase catabolic TdcB; Threonine deaminase &gt; L-threonine dehydratase catabolic TdcB; Threonine deaminase &gt; L-threonine dehydratase catabolic TdcB; Threonine deaminase &gt; L-threonine dehydratase catabolic TdcB; Threonine deaminase
MANSLRQPIEEAASRLLGNTRHTVLESSTWLAELAGEGTIVNLKLENQQVSGSFKARGAFNKMSMVVSECPSCRPVLASTGNHALACSWAAGRLNVNCDVHVPQTVSEAKLRALQHETNLTVCLSGTDCIDAESAARRAAKENGQPYVSPYNDIDVVCGQGTIGKEILEDMPNVDVILVSVGGGGLIAGISAYVKEVKPSVKVIGCQPAASQVMAQSIAVGEIREFPQSDTLSDGTAGGIEEGSVTFGLCKRHVDEWIMVSEETIAKSVRFMVEYHQQIVEGAAGVALGAFIDQPQRFAGQNVAIVICGGRIGIDVLRKILA